MKIYKGWNWNKKGVDAANENSIKIVEDYVYYNEREWRYVPNIPNEEFIIKVRGQNIDVKQLSLKTKDFCLKPEVKDIKYLIVNSEEERIEMLNMIDKLFRDNKTYNEVILLKSKILTYEQIRADF